MPQNFPQGCGSWQIVSRIICYNSNSASDDNDSSDSNEDDDFKNNINNESGNKKDTNPPVKEKTKLITYLVLGYISIGMGIIFLFAQGNKMT